MIQKPGKLWQHGPLVRSILHSDLSSTKNNQLLLFALFDQGYRYYAGIGVASNCESALTYYRRVSNQGMLGTGK